MPQVSPRTERTSAPGHIAHPVVRSANLLSKPVTAGVKAIVPGDRISTVRHETFTFDDVATALAKRYRGEKNQLAARAARQIEAAVDKFDTIAEAVEAVKAELVIQDGSDRNVILTPAELKDREVTQEAVGIMNALMGCLAKGNAGEKQIKAIMRPQFSMRKVRRDCDTVCDTLLRTLKYEGYIFLTGGGTCFGLRADNPLKPEQYAAYYKRVIYNVE